MSFPQIIKIIIADDHKLFRTGLISAFSAQQKEEFQIIGEAANGNELIKLLSAVQPDVVLMDIAMPYMNGIIATTLIKKDFPEVRVVALSYSDAKSVVLEMIGAGSDGYLLKDTELDELAHAIRSVHAGSAYFTPAVATHLTTYLREEKAKSIDNRKRELTKREVDIVQRICEGESSKDIATALFISKRTVDTYREKIMEKAGAKNMMQLLRFALKNHLLKESALFLLTSSGGLGYLTVAATLFPNPLSTNL